MPIELVLYSTTHCHLCEQAASLLILFEKEYPIKWSAVEIAYDDTLLNLYELKIPVLKRLDNDRELDWPFTMDEIVKLVY